MAQAQNPYGDGHAAARILDAIAKTIKWSLLASSNFTRTLFEKWSS
jgi:UDP-N-acetylglucosamine 2-epimerase